MGVFCSFPLPRPCSLVWHSQEGNRCTHFLSMRGTRLTLDAVPASLPGSTPSRGPGARRWQELPCLHNPADTEAKSEPRPTSRASHAAFAPSSSLLAMGLPSWFAAATSAIQLWFPLKFSPLLSPVNSSTRSFSVTCRDNPSVLSEAEGSDLLQFTSVTSSLSWCWCFPERCSSSACYTEASLSPDKFSASVAHPLADRVCEASRLDFWNCCSRIFLADIKWAGNFSTLPPP